MQAAPLQVGAEVAVSVAIACAERTGLRPTQPIIQLSTDASFASWKYATTSPLSLIVIRLP